MGWATDGGGSVDAMHHLCDEVVALLEFVLLVRLSLGLGLRLGFGFGFGVEVELLGWGRGWWLVLVFWG